MNLQEYKINLYKETLRNIASLKSNLLILKKNNFERAVAEYEYDILVLKNKLEYIRKTANIHCEVTIKNSVIHFKCLDQDLIVSPHGKYKCGGLESSYNYKLIQPITLAAEVFDIPIELINFKNTPFADEMGCSNP